MKEKLKDAAAILFVLVLLLLVSWLLIGSDATENAIELNERYVNPSP